MAANERDDTGEWLLPAAKRPPTMAQLEQRIDHALAIARASEAAALEIGEVALDAAEQARRAAELAERASGGMVGGGSIGAAPAAGPEVDQGPDPVGAESAYDSFRSFLERADRVSARLEAIAPAPSMD